MEFHQIRCLGEFWVEKESTLPTWTSADESRMIYVESDDIIYWGSASGWESNYTLKYDLNANNNKITNLASPTLLTDAANKNYVDLVAQGINWQASVLSRRGVPGGTPTTGDRYISTATSGGWTNKYIYEWSTTPSGHWVETIPVEGYACWVDDEDRAYAYNGSGNWVAFASIVHHNNLANIDGGSASAGEYYHLTQAEHTDVQSNFVRIDLDTDVSAHTEWQDNYKAKFGNDGDLQLYHNGTNSYIDNVTGSLYLRVNANENSILCEPNAAVKLYYNNNMKLETTNTGATLTGVLGADGLDMGDNEKILLGIGDDLQLYHDGAHSYIDNVTGNLYLRVNGNELALTLQANGATTLYYDASIKLGTTSTGVTITGTLSADCVRVGDNENIELGDGQDLQIYHNGSHTYIDNVTGTFNIRVNTNEDAIQATPNDAVYLFYDNVWKFRTTATGAESSGDLKLSAGTTVNEFSIDGTLAGNSDDAAPTEKAVKTYVDTVAGYVKTAVNTDVSAHTEWQDNYEVRFGNDNDMQIYHDNVRGKIVNATGSLYVSAGDQLVEIYGNTFIKLMTNDESIRLGSETDGISLHRTPNTIYVEAAGTTFNQSNADVDFSVHGDAGNPRIFLEGSSSFVRIGYLTGGAAPNYQLDVQQAAATYVARFWNDGDNAANQGISIWCGKDDASGQTKYVSCYDGNGQEVGYIWNNNGTFELVDGSDERIKCNIEDSNINGLDIINNLKVREFNYKKNPNGLKRTGLIAQEVQGVYNEAVAIGDDDMLGVSKEAFIMPLVKAIQEISQKIDDIDNRLKVVEKKSKKSKKKRTIKKGKK